MGPGPVQILDGNKDVVDDRQTAATATITETINCCSPPYLHRLSLLVARFPVVGRYDKLPIYKTPSRLVQSARSAWGSGLPESVKQGYAITSCGYIFGGSTQDFDVILVKRLPLACRWASLQGTLLQPQATMFVSIL